MNNQTRSGQSGQSGQVQLLTDINRNLTFYSSIFISLPGLFLNILNLIVFRGKSFEGSVRIFYTFQSIFDFIRTLNTMYLQFPAAFTQDISLLSELNCRLFNFFQRAIGQICSWILVLNTIDRMICILFGVKYKQIAGKKYAYSLLGFIFVTIVALNWINFTLVNVINQVTLANQTTILRFSRFPSQFNVYSQIFGFLIRAFLPFITRFQFCSHRFVH
jgi:hypothetical protein